MKLRYQNIDMNPAKLLMIDRANTIIAEYMERGRSLTLRQLYYQLVARGFIPNDQKQYRLLGDIISKGRLAGLVDWEAIEDITRNIRKRPEWSTAKQGVEAMADQYRCDLWKGQLTRPEVWVEKDAQLSTISYPANKMACAYFSCRGYTSLSEVWGAAQRIASRWRYQKQRTLIIHLGDHDPSGIDMSRDIEERLEMFVRVDLELRGSTPVPFTLKRIALNMPQIEEYNPPPNPAKETDSRFKSYREAHGDTSWELDALPPEVIDEMIIQEIDPLIDRERWNTRVAFEQGERNRIQNLADAME